MNDVSCAATTLPNYSEPSIVIPLYNSEQTISQLVEAIIITLSNHFSRFTIVLVDDGSQDATNQIARDIQLANSHCVKYIRLARNFGEHNAVICGLNHVNGDCVVILDDDFQNPPSEVLKLIQKLCEGYDVVYSYYSTKQHSWFRNFGSRLNDRLATLLLGKSKGLYLSSFKAMNRFMVDVVTAYHGPFPYIDGLILRSTRLIGQQLCEHRQREAGRSNYTIRRLAGVWLSSFTSFSIVPLRVATILGFVISLLGLLMAGFFIYVRLYGSVVTSQMIPPGWASLIVTTTIFSGIQLCVLGIFGEYLGRIMLIQSGAPQFVIRDIHE